MFAAVCADIGETESLGLIEVELHGGSGFLTAAFVLNL